MRIFISGLLFLIPLFSMANLGLESIQSDSIPPVVEIENTCSKKKKYCKGKMSFENGNSYEGEFKYGLPHGWGTYQYSNDNIFIGEFLDGYRHGHGQQNFGNGDNYAGDWRNDVIHGKGVYMWSDGSKFVGTYFNGVMQGKGILTLINGESYDGEWKNGLADGEGEYNKIDGSKYVGNHSAGKRDGSGVITFRTGDVFIGKWKNGLSNRKGSFHFTNGDTYACIWENGELTKDATYILKNGKQIKGDLIKIAQNIEKDEELMESMSPNIGVSWYYVGMEKMESKKFSDAKEAFMLARKFVPPSSDLNKLIYQQLQIIETKVEDSL